MTTQRDQYVAHITKMLGHIVGEGRTTLEGCRAALPRELEL